MKRLIVLSVLFAALFTACDGGKKAATVNGQAISLEDLDREYQRVVAPIVGSGQTLEEAQIQEIRTDILNRLIEVELLQQAAVASGQTVEDAEVSSEMDVIRGQFPSDQQFQDALKAAGLTEKELVRQLERQMLVQQHIEAKTDDLVLITDREITNYYRDNPELFVTPEQVRASHILIQVTPQAPAEVKQKARDQINEVRSLLLGGADFAETARERSEGPSGPNGGDLGFFGPGQMVPPFEEVAFALSPGQISEVVETQFGYHVIQVTERKASGVLEFEDVKDNVKEILEREKGAEAMTKYIEGLRDQADIKILVEEEPAA